MGTLKIGERVVHKDVPDCPGTLMSFSLEDDVANVAWDDGAPADQTLSDLRSMAVATFPASERPARRMAAHQGKAYDVVLADGRDVGHILKAKTGYFVNVVLDEHAMADDAAGDLPFPDFKSAKEAVITFLVAPDLFVAPEADGEDMSVQP